MSDALAQLVAQAQGYRPVLGQTSNERRKNEALKTIKRECAMLLTDQPQSATQLAARIGCKTVRAKAMLDELVEEGVAQQVACGAHGQFVGFARVAA